MALLYDARGNEIRVGWPDSVTNEVITDARPITAVLGSLNAEVLMDLNSAATATYDIRTAAGALTLVFEGMLDGGNYFALPAFAQQQLLAAAITQESYVASIVIATTQSGIYTVGVTGLRRVRVRVSAYTSGNVTVAARASRADLIIFAKQIPANLHVTNTGASGAGVTLTLPAPPVGLFHYITNITIQRAGAAALAGTAVLVITSTNLPGSPAWSVGNASAAGGSLTDLNYSPNSPLKSSVAATATTIVAPAPGAGVLWRLNASYYVGA